LSQGRAKKQPPSHLAAGTEPRSLVGAFVWATSFLVSLPAIPKRKTSKDARQTQSTEQKLSVNRRGRPYYGYIDQRFLSAKIPLWRSGASAFADHQSGRVQVHANRIFGWCIEMSVRRRGLDNLTVAFDGRCEAILRHCAFQYALCLHHFIRLSITTCQTCR